MTQQQKAEAYVRAQLPELMELTWGCTIRVNLSEGGGARATVVGKTPHQVHWSWAEHHENKSSFVGSEMDGRYEVVGHPIQLQHWLRVLDYSKVYLSLTYISPGLFSLVMNNKTTLTFNLTTGQPATEADYLAFNDIVGV